MGFNSGITLYGYYSQDPAILDDVVLPEGLDRGELVIEILHSCGSLYPFIQHPEMLKESIHNWFKINERNFERILLAVMAEYSPIENYDRTEEHKIIRSGNETENGTNQNNRSEINQSSSNVTMTDSSSGTSSSSTVTSTDGSETDQRAADNSETFRNTTKRISEADSNGTDNSTTTTSTRGSNVAINDGSLSGNENGSFQTGRNKSENETESIRAHGNIGTTKNSEMVLDEIELRKYNIYEDIASRFADKFLLCIY